MAKNQFNLIHYFKVEIREKPLHISWYTVHRYQLLIKVPNIVWILLQLLLIAKKTTEVHETLSAAGQFIEAYSGTPLQKESLKVFFFVLQVCHYLMAGQVCSCLRLVTISVFNWSNNVNHTAFSHILIYQKKWSPMGGFFL